MNKIKKTFSDWRSATPKRVQWLLLAAAFVVVLILLTLLLMGGDNEKIEEVDSAPVNLVVKPDSVDWPDVMVGESKTQVIEISATGPAKILAVRRDANINGLNVNTGCMNAGEINAGFACTITIDYAPTTAMTARGVPLFIEWRGINVPDEMKNEYKYTMVIGAVSPKVETPQPVVVEKVIEKIIEKPVEKTAEPEPDEEEYEEEIEEEPEVDLIATTKPFDTVKPRTNDEYVAPPESCSDFAFPGYDNSGRQIGWIKPKGGAYYFHPFADKKCENATGVYNPNSGIITDIKDTSKKIGTDADHIGYATITNGVIPELSNPVKVAERESLIDTENRITSGMGRLGDSNSGENWIAMGGKHDAPKPDVEYESSGDMVVSSKIHDRQFLLRQYKPIPATIVSDVRADVEALSNGNMVPVRATVDRNVYSDSGRNVIIPTGTMMLGYVTGTLPGPYTSVGRMNIKWYQFILPNGVEFNFDGDNDPFSADSQGKVGVPGYGSTDYIEQFFMPMLTAIVPAAVNLIAPVTDAFVNQIDLDNNTVVQSGTVRSSELAKNEIITAWNQVAQKLLVDMMDNTVPPFTIAAGTRINVYSPVDLMVTCGSPDDPNNAGKKCAVAEYGDDKRQRWAHNAKPNYDDGSWTGQVRSFAVTEYCITDKNGNKTVDPKCKDTTKCGGYDYATLLFYCQSQNYQAINMAKQDAVFQSQQQKFQDTYKVSNTGQGLTGVQGDQAYNEQVLGLTYDEDGYIENPFEEKEDEVIIEASETVLTCEDGSMPDANGCCAGEIYTDMGDQGFNCCPSTGGDCFPPIL
ncbi:MAG: hypothetical protein IJ500_02530 [Alphaproteobacteria bacterium]|nr:hypothetical protein [Alphaproteobacteria bacterium]MBQ8729513.1 hypothetical protein [Alphaproteobacteria bacterium]